LSLEPAIWTAIAGLALTVLGFAVGWAFRAGGDAARIAVIERWIETHQSWAIGRDRDLTADHEAIVVLQVGFRSMVQDVKNIQRDMRELRDFWITQKSANPH